MTRTRLLGMLLVAVSPPLAAVDRHVAIGDSITVGTSWPATGCTNCPAVFDCVPGCTATNNGREGCGYVKRLDDWLGAGDRVRNEGRGGQDTLGALSRFDQEMDENCGTPGICISVLLMHGTNDMAASMISPETARDNLAAMIDKAKLRNIDVLLMTIIRKVYAPGNLKWSDYRNLILALAGTKNLQSVDPWAPLCPGPGGSGNACYNANYWVPGSQCTGANDTTLGHLDPDGYEVLTDLVRAAFPASAPVAPSPTSPMGDVTDATPDFVWPSVATARWYLLEVDGSQTWWEGAAVCSGGTCTVNPGVTLAEGAHTWKVKGRNLRGLGAFSAAKSFNVVSTPPPPPAPVPTGPTGEFFGHAPRYEWQEATGATEYDLRIFDSGGALDAFANLVPAATACSGGQCSWIEGTVLGDPDVYTLRVRARNAGGMSALSPGLDFTILECVDDTPMNLHDLEPSPVVFPPKSVVYCGALEAAESATYTVEPSGTLTVQTRDGFTAFDGFTVKGTFSLRSP